jgi:hypothetical protein
MERSGLNASIFSTVFNSTTNSYKYYWWLAILHLIKENRTDTLTFDDISFKMLSLVWHPINYYKVSLGKQDQLTKYVIEIKNDFLLNDDISETDFILFLKQNRDNRIIRNILNKMMKYVPYRFIRPWVKDAVALPDAVVNDIIIKLHKYNNTVYNINKKNDGIYFTEEWFSFLKNNFKIIEDFTLYNLIKYVEKKNPEISNISVRLWRPKSRKLVLPTKLWKSFITDNSEKSSVFSDLFFSDFNTLSIDHYLPWSYITHDKLWNLHPVENSVNSSKSNSLPDNKYLEKFSLLQYDFMHYVGNNFEKELLDYDLLFNTNNRTVLSIPQARFVSEFKGKLESHIQIASNMGFRTDWLY